jgi:hypothetical protein
VDGLSAAARLAEPDASRAWRELLHGHGVSDVASTVFRDRYGRWAFLDLWRTGGTFTSADLAFPDAIVGALTAELSRCQAGTFTRSRGGSPQRPDSSWSGKLDRTPAGPDSSWLHAKRKGMG